MIIGIRAGIRRNGAASDQHHQCIDGNGSVSLSLPDISAISRMVPFTFAAILILLTEVLSEISESGISRQWALAAAAVAGIYAGGNWSRAIEMYRDSIAGRFRHRRECFPDQWAKKQLYDDGRNLMIDLKKLR
jgi:hypothetical protein